MKKTTAGKERVRDESLTEVTQALLNFFKRQGDGDEQKGYKVVADVVGVNRQQLYYIITGRNEPTLKTVMLILKHYPNEHELRRAISLPVGTLALSASNGQPSERERQLEEELRQLRIKHDKLVDVVLAEKLGKEMSFLGVSNPAAPRMPIGFGSEKRAIVPVRMLAPDFTYPARLES